MNFAVKHESVCVCVCVDKPMQLNQALFMLGGGSGYVPQPDIMREDAFDPFDKDTLHVEPITIQLQVSSGWSHKELKRHFWVEPF